MGAKAEDYMLVTVLITFAVWSTGISKEVTILDTAKAQGDLGWLPDPAENGWSESQVMLNGTQSYMYQDCNLFEQQTNWLRTNWIYRGEARRIFIELKFTVRDCKNLVGVLPVGAVCKETFNLLYLESERDHGILFHRHLFTKIDTLAPDESFTLRGSKAGDMQFNTEVRSVGELSQRGFYLAFQNFGACVALVAVRVYYQLCPADTRNLARFAETVGGAEGLLEVAGVCVENAEEDGTPKMHCSSDGEWLIPVHQCRCKVGYEQKDGRCKACNHGYYKAAVELVHCLKCPLNSMSVAEGSTSCPCKKGFYRARSEMDGTPCTQPPSPPRNASASVTGLKVALKWLPPEDLGGRRDLSYSVECEKCPWETEICEPCSSAVTFNPRSDGLSGPAVTVEGLDSYTNYTFRIAATNGVSELSGTRPYITTMVTVRHGVSPKVTEVTLMSRGENTIKVKWAVFQHRSASFQGYDVMYGEKGENNSYNVKQIKEAMATLEELQPGTTYLVQVRVLTPIGPGPYSSAYQFQTLPAAESKSPAVGILVSCILGALLVLLLICGALYIRNRRAQQKGGRGEYGCTASSREKVPLKPYVDLHAYEDPSQAFLQFTREIEPSHLSTENTIGEGEFGEVYRGVLKYPGKERIPVAIKTLKSTYSESQWWNFLREATIMGQFHHPNIIHLEGVVTRKKPMMILTEFMENGALDSFLRENDGKFSPFQLTGMLSGIASGMKYLSDRNYVHRDLAARNILVNRDLECKVSDFGLSRILQDDEEGTYETRGGKIPIRWTAPEAIAYRTFTSASDVWSYGILMWEVLSYGDKPYGEMSNQEVMKWIEDGNRLPPPIDCPSVLFDLMKSCWAYERAKRPKFSDLLSELDHIMSSPTSLRTLADFDHRATLRLASCSSEGIPYKSVTEWLDSIRMKRYQEHFHIAGLDTMESLLELTAEDLKQMGIAMSGHQKRILCSIQGFKD
ncbi:ephrin type-A receptor 1 [Latimeria chalumnae]|uniref:ephrin type-A receptor 1 n=1 Tax=Latimeria chalumnae TaxID=7897 RepID=UPI00313A82CB